MSASHQIRRRPSDSGVLRIAVSGDIDIAAHDELLQAILSSLHVGVSELVIDLERVTFFDSGAVGVLVAGSNAARRAGCGYRIVNPPTVVHRVLETNGILHLLTAVGPRPSTTSPTGPAGAP